MFICKDKKMIVIGVIGVFMVLGIVAKVSANHKSVRFNDYKETELGKEVYYVEDKATKQLEEESKISETEVFKTKGEEIERGSYLPIEIEDNLGNKFGSIYITLNNFTLNYQEVSNYVEEYNAISTNKLEIPSEEEIKGESRLGVLEIGVLYPKEYNIPHQETSIKVLGKRRINDKRFKGKSYMLVGKDIYKIVEPIDISTGIEVDNGEIENRAYLISLPSKAKSEDYSVELEVNNKKGKIKVGRADEIRHKRKRK